MIILNNNDIIILLYIIIIISISNILDMSLSIASSDNCSSHTLKSVLTTTFINRLPVFNKQRSKSSQKNYDNHRLRSFVVY